MQMKRITICACSSRTFISKEKVAKLAVSAEKAGMEVVLVSDLCEMCEDKMQEVHAVAQSVVAACYPRAVKSLLAFAGEENCQTVDLRGEELSTILAQLGVEAVEVSAEEMTPWMQQMAIMPKKLGEDAWYPTLDKDVCAECGKCLEFCPFGVYEMVDDRICVMNPHNCKNNCPACARTCPASAIIFPKYDRSPINGGEEKQEKAVQLDTKTLYNETFRQKLALRKLRGPITSEEK